MPINQIFSGDVIQHTLSYLPPNTAAVCKQWKELTAKNVLNQYRALGERFASNAADGTLWLAHPTRKRLLDIETQIGCTGMLDTSSGRVGTLFAAFGDEDVMLLMAGNHYFSPTSLPSIVSGNKVTFVGMGRTVSKMIVQASFNPVIFQNQGSSDGMVSFENLRIEFIKHYAILIQSACSVTFTNCDIVLWGAISLSEGCGLTFQNCRIYKGRDFAIPHAISAQSDSNKVQIRNSMFFGYSWCLKVGKVYLSQDSDEAQPSLQVTIRDNVQVIKGIDCAEWKAPVDLRSIVTTAGPMIVFKKYDLCRNRKQPNEFEI